MTGDCSVFRFLWRHEFRRGLIVACEQASWRGRKKTFGELSERKYICLPSSVKQQREMTIRLDFRRSLVYVLRRLRNVDDDGYFFVFSFGIERRRCIFSLSTFLEPLAYRIDLDNRDCRL